MDNNTFWNLIKTHKIEVPVIQRDYAQGRESKKSTSIRTTFIMSIIDALQNEDQPLHLNFVYGKIKGIKDIKKIESNKDAIERMLTAVQGYSDSLDFEFKYTLKDNNSSKEINTTFIPLDGQQRLTTLFLFHLYILKRCSLLEEALYLLNFTYLIRPSTKQFCNEIIKQELNIVKDKTITDTIIDTSWFFLYWLKDPTIKGMLTTLDEIHNQCKYFDEAKVHSIKDMLLSTKSISFELLDLDELELTDNLYIKMNSRGKQLTKFENFKSWLMEYIDKNNLEVDITDWKEKLDTVWSDLFWEHKDDSNMLIDEEMFRYFRNMMQIYFILNNEIDGTVAEKKDLYQENRKKAYLLARDKGSDDEYIYLDFKDYVSFNVLNEQFLNELFYCLELFSRNKENDQVVKYFKKFVTGNMGLEDKVFFYTMFLFLKTNKNGFSEYLLNQFVRVYTNLIKNSQIDSIVILRNIIRGAIADSKKFNDIYSNIIDNKISFTGFRGSQKDEEILKAYLLLNKSEKWNELINTGETHPFFDGQIGFLFVLIGLNPENFVLDIASWDIEKEQRFLQLYEEYFLIVSFLFSELSIKDEKYLFERALLTVDDYLYRSGKYRNAAKKTFWKLNKDRDNSWHRILREYVLDKNEDYFKAWSTFSKLVNKLRDTGKNLQSLCDEYQGNDWRSCFISYPETIDRCGNYRHFINWGKEFYLLSKSDRSSDFCELNSFYFFKSELEKNPVHPFENPRYYACRQKDDFPCAVVGDYIIGEFKFSIDIRFYFEEDEPWELRLFSRKKNIKMITKKTKQILQDDLELEFDSDGYYKNFSGNISFEEISETIKKIVLKLINISEDEV